MRKICQSSFVIRHYLCVSPIQHFFTMKKLLFCAATAALLLQMSACKSDKIECLTDPQGEKYFDWGYSYTNGPELWGQCYEDCNGKKQSPINIETSKAESDAALTALQLDYQPTPLHVLNNGHAIELEYEEGSTLQLDGASYELKQAHFHAGSEHSINDEFAESEIHLVHKTAAGDFAVIGVMIEEGAENAFFAQFFDNLPMIEGQHYENMDASLNILDMLPANRAYYTYEGSLTTPRCTEGVKWIVLQEPITASAQQIELLHAILHVTHRPVQKLNRRTVRKFD